MKERGEVSTESHSGHFLFLPLHVLCVKRFASDEVFSGRASRRRSWEWLEADGIAHRWGKCCSRSRTGHRGSRVPGDSSGRVGESEIECRKDVGC